MSNLAQLDENMNNSGLRPPSNMLIDGKIHRFHVIGDKPGSKNGYYRIFDHGYMLAGSFGCWKRGIHEKFCSKPAKDMTAKEKSAFSKMKQQHDDDLEKQHAECRKKAASIWKQASKDDKKEHPYVERKGIYPYKARVTEKGNLLVPVHDIDKKIHGLQFIYADPKKNKMFLRGTAKFSHFLLLGKITDDVDKIIVCEGYATGCSLRQATKLPVVVSFDAGNLLPVAEAFRAKYPKIKIIIAGDDDHASKSGNAGKKKAIAAAKAVKGIAVFPEFVDGDGNTDFNDMHQEQGLEAVKDVIMVACSKAPDDEETWPEPLLFGSIDTPDIPCDLLPEPLAEFCEVVKDHTQTPSGLTVMMVLAIVAACLQKRVAVAPYGDSYVEPVNLMTVTAVESGSRKTAVVNAATKSLSDWEKEQAKVLKDEVTKIQHNRDMLKKSIEAIKAKASKPDATDEERREALNEIKHLEDSMPADIILPQLWVDDVTVEKLEMLMVEHDERMAVISDEGGFFEVISGLYSGGKININVVLQSHAGSAVRVQRMGRSVTLDNPALSLGLAVQPDIVASLATGSKARFRGNGMLARLLYCVPESTVGSRDVSKRKSIPDTVMAKYDVAIHRLLSVKPLYDDYRKERPRILTLSSEARELWQEFSQCIENKQGKFGEYNSIRDWTCKLPGAVLRIAGLCHVVEHGISKKNRIINKATIQRAIKLGNLLIVHAKVAFGMMGCEGAVSDAKYVLQWIIDNGSESFRRGDLHKALHGRFTRVERLISALKVLAERHVISEPEERHTGRRPEIVYQVNPAIFE